MRSRGEKTFSTAARYSLGRRPGNAQPWRKDFSPWLEIKTGREAWERGYTCS